MRTMTKKEEQRIAQQERNNIIGQAVVYFNEYMTSLPAFESVKRLRSCSAEVITTEKYFILRSYKTTVAFIQRDTDTLYDVLRLVYGYTHTSAQHINKFEKDYCKGKWNCAHCYQWRAC